MICTLSYGRMTVYARRQTVQMQLANARRRMTDTVECTWCLLIGE